VIIFWIANYNFFTGKKYTGRLVVSTIHGKKLLVSGIKGNMEISTMVMCSNCGYYRGISY
jgi:hypothetical protein